MREYVLATALFLAILPAGAQQLTRCQCTYKGWVGDCTATVKQNENWITVTSSTQQCSRVDWYADAQPQVTVVMGGKESLEWLGQAKTPQLTVQSCKVCKDSEFSTGRAADSPQDSASSEPQAPVSPFQGFWVGDDKNVHGYSNATQVRLNVIGTSITGTWAIQGEPPKPVTGTITGNKAKIRIHAGGASLTLELVDDTTMKYKWMFSSAVLRKQ
jgi:hypothetical protein